MRRFVSLDSLRERLPQLPRDRRIIVYCAAGQRAYLACRILSQHGFPEVYNLSGGYKTYEFVTEKQANEDIFEGNVIGKDDNIYQTTVKGG
jgi:rhodanese-related sulfurtransferase